MTQDQGLHPWPSPTAVYEPRTPYSTLPVLIQVPVVPELLHAEASGERHPRVARPGMRPHSPRRRLRREVKAAALAVLVAVPLTLACLRPLMSMSRTTAEGESHPPVSADDPLRPPAVSIFLEPSGLSPYVDVNPPVVLPGYLLPDDDSEEPAHAGS